MKNCWIGVKQQSLTHSLNNLFVKLIAMVLQLVIYTQYLYLHQKTKDLFCEIERNNAFESH